MRIAPIVESAMCERDERQAACLEPKKRQEQTGAESPDRRDKCERDRCHVLNMQNAGKRIRDMPQRPDHRAHNGGATRSQPAGQTRKQKSAPTYFFEEG